MYVFPGIGLGAILSKSVNVTQDMIYASAVSLSTSLNEEEKANGWLYPDIRRIREVSIIVTRGVIRAAQKNGVDRELAIRNLNDKQLDQYIEERMYDPFKEREHLLKEVSEITAKHPESFPDAVGATKRTAVAASAAHL
jgi:malate dehydrogenase (oxaloacetate-decarboxylating)(NADP+)